MDSDGRKRGKLEYAMYGDSAAVKMGSSHLADFLNSNSVPETDLLRISTEKQNLLSTEEVNPLLDQDLPMPGSMLGFLRILGLFYYSLKLRSCFYVILLQSEVTNPLTYIVIFFSCTTLQAAIESCQSFLVSFFFLLWGLLWLSTLLIRNGDKGGPDVACVNETAISNKWKSMITQLQEMSKTVTL